MMVKRKIIEIDEELCNGCGDCVPSCAEGAIQIIDGKAKVVKDSFCDGLGACLNDCPMDALQVVEREAEAFDEEAVQVHLEKIAAKPSLVNLPLTDASPVAPGCPSAAMRSFDASEASSPGTENSPSTRTTSALSHWPVQIHLIPPSAPFLKGADLLVTADCVPVAYPNFHTDFLQDKTILLGCPKLDQTDLYIDKFAAIFQEAGVKSITTLIMEVPCCSGLPVILKSAMEKAGVWIPMEEVVISIREGKVLRRSEAAYQGEFLSHLNDRSQVRS